MELTIAVLTYRRPEDIAAVLPQLVEQAVSVTDSGLTARILVIDNDPAGSAREYVTAFANAAPAAPVVYVLEDVPGISAARNRALIESASSSLLVFIDDDERPTEHWLELMLKTQREYSCAAVAGPVISEYSSTPSAWLTAGRFFDRRRMPTGSVLDVAATNNLLLDLERVRQLGLAFDLGSGLTGGEDTLFTRELHTTSTLVWCDEAIVTDIVPPQRLTRQWVLQRAMSSGNSWSLTELKLTPPGLPTARARVVLTLKAFARMLGGAVRLVGGWVTRSLGHRARGTRTIMRGWGMLLGAWGYSHVEYKRPATPVPAQPAS
jgi:succinoglycan biosynthesis protein ExoM